MTGSAKDELHTNIYRGGDAMKIKIGSWSYDGDGIGVWLLAALAILAIGTVGIALVSPDLAKEFIHCVTH